MSIQVLLIEDDLVFSSLLLEFMKLSDDILACEHVDCLTEGVRFLQGSPGVDVILLDLSLPDSVGLNTLRVLLSITDIPIVVLTGSGNKQIAIEALQMGAQDYMFKGSIHEQVLVRSLLFAVERNRLALCLEESEEHFRGTFEQVAVGMAHVDLTGSLLRYNEKFCEILGFSHDALTGISIHELLHTNIHKRKKIQEFEDLLQDLSQHCSFEAFCIQQNEQETWVHLTLSLVKDRDNKPSFIVAVLENIMHQKQIEEQLHLNQHYDPLTSLPNRSLLMEKLARAMRSYQQNPKHLFALLFLDIDHFKNVNDGLGHAFGDQLLLEVAHRLKSELRGGDLLSRWGGDEFCLLLEPLRTLDEVENIAERLQRSIAKPFVLEEQEVFVSASIGIVGCSDEYETAEELLRDADIAMHQAKKQGRARHILFQGSMHNHVVSRLKLESDLHRALEREEFCAHYQPIMDLTTKQLSGFEALVRWNHPELGLVAPWKFVPVAEETGLIVSIDRWILSEACCQLKSWQQQFPHASQLSMSVNLSTQHFVQENIVQDVRDALCLSGIQPECLRLEITESAIIQHQDKACKLLVQLKQLGVQIYMDDFGTGYSSLSYLQRFEVDVLKVDRSFVSNIGNDKKQEEIIQIIVMLAQKLQLGIVAEGIETEEQQDYLRELGCQLGQGYLYAKPLPKEQASFFIEENYPPDENLSHDKLLKEPSTSISEIKELC